MATDGAEAVALYAQRRAEIDLVLTDMMMPIMDGSSTIDALRRIDPSVRIVAASGITENEGMGRVTGGAVDHFLAKPYAAETLLKSLDSDDSDPDA